MKKYLLLLVSLLALFGFVACSSQVFEEDLIGRWVGTKEDTSTYCFFENQEFEYEDGPFYTKGIWEYSDGKLITKAQFKNDDNGELIPCDYVLVYKVSFICGKLHLRVNGGSWEYERVTKPRKPVVFN